MTVLLHRYSHTDAPRLREMLLDVHDDCYADSDSAFDTREKFGWLLDRWASRLDWDCVVGYDDEEPVGFAYGAPLAAGSTWWSGIDGLGTEFTAETGRRTFALSELMVRPKWRKTGTAQRLHEELIAGRREERVTLLVDGSHPKVQGLYETWGYESIGRKRPFPDAPLLTVMVHPTGQVTA